MKQYYFSQENIGGLSDEEFTEALKQANKNAQSDTKPPRIPKVGEIVLFTPNPDDAIAKSNHNDGDIPAIVTRVWSHGCVNVKIIPDCGPMQDRTSVVHNSLNPAGYHFKFQDEAYPPIPDKK